MLLDSGHLCDGDDVAVGVLPVTSPLIPVAVLITGGSMKNLHCCVLVVFHKCSGFSASN